MPVLRVPFALPGRSNEEAGARAGRLADLAGREPAAWRKVDELIATNRQNDYDRAVGLLVELREVAEKSGRGGEFATRIRELRERQARKSSLIERFDKTGLQG